MDSHNYPRTRTMKRLLPTLVAIASAAGLCCVSVPAARADLAPGQTPASILIYGRGNGHGRGMSQFGSLGWATVYNKTWQEIVNFYYEGTTLSQLTEADAGLTQEQQRRFEAVLASLQEQNLGGGCRHLANSAGTLRHRSLQVPLAQAFHCE